MPPTRPIELTLEQLKGEFDPIEIVAVCQCAGNRRGLADPHVPGVEWGEGAVGNARWKGARLKDILARAAMKPQCVEVAFDGGDGPVLEATPDFVKSVPVWKAIDEHTLVAYEMNGAALPHWNGFPARLIVPGWAGTYWVKQLISISALTQPLKSFWVNTAYRIPKGKFPSVDRFLSQESETTTPVTEIDVTSLMTNISEGQRFRLGASVQIHGIAWDAGYGIRRVEVSLDDGRSWAQRGTRDRSGPILIPSVEVCIHTAVETRHDGDLAGHQCAGDRADRRVDRQPGRATTTMSCRESASTSHEDCGMKILASAAGTVLLAVCAAPSIADESQIHLKDDPDAAIVRADCSICHSPDYIEMNSRF